MEARGRGRGRGREEEGQATLKKAAISRFRAVTVRYSIRNTFETCTTYIQNGYRESHASQSTNLGSLFDLGRLCFLCTHCTDSVTDSVLRYSIWIHKYISNLINVIETYIHANICLLCILIFRVMAIVIRQDLVRILEQFEYAIFH